MSDDNSQMNSALITGTSTGIGRASALRLDRAGIQVFAGVRRGEDADRLSRGFALIYSVSSLSGLLGPIFFGVLGDNFGIETAMFAMALISMLAIPPIILLQSQVNAPTGKT